MRDILVRSPNWIGDQIMAYPFFHYLRAAYPGARIGALCVPWVETSQFRNLVDEVIVLPKPERPGLLAGLSALEEGARQARARGPWELGLVLPNSFSSAWVFARAGVRRRRGYATDGRGWLLHEKLRWPSRSVEHRAQAYLGVLPEEARPAKSATDFWGAPASNDLEEDVPGVIGSFDAARAWPDAQPLDPPPGDYWVLAPGATADSRRWPVERFAALARSVALETGWSGVVVGGLAEAALAETLCGDPSLKLLDLTAQGPVTCLWKVFAGARFTVSNDSGLAHVAALCGSPVQVVWGAGDPKRTRPLGRKRIQVLFSPIECWPCERNRCPLPDGQKHACLRELGPGAVWKEIQDGIRP